MLLELLATAGLMWAGADNSGQATINVSCDLVEVHYGGAPSSSKKNVSFWMKDLRYGHTYLYVVAMPVGGTGQILLEPATYWVEELKVQKEIVLRIDNKHYIFDLSGSYDAIKCD